MSDIKTCPFCNVAPEFFPKDPKNEGDAWTRIECVNRRCPARPSVEKYSEHRRIHRASAIRAWNKRATTP